MPTPMKLYIKAGCPWCHDAIAWLDARGFAHDVVDVRSDASAFEEMRRLSGQTLAPTLVVGDKLLPDFDTGQLESFLAKHGIIP